MTTNGSPAAADGDFATDAAVHNLRDFGGYATAAGARLKAGRLWRSGQLEVARPGLDGVLARLGVTVIIDLRAASECGLPQGAAFAGFAGQVRRASAHDETIPHAVGAILGMTTPGEVAAHMAGIYRTLPSSPRFRESMGHLVDALACEDGVTLVHCFAGKDRTGLAVALVQLALGVHRDDVFHDYLLTNAMGPERIAFGLAALLGRRKVAAPEWVLHEAMSVRAEYLEAGLARVGEMHESPAACLAGAAGLSVPELHRIGERLLA